MRVEEQQAVFQRWLHEHAGVMLKVVRTFAVHRSDQDDLLQEVLFKVWLSIPSYRGDAKETTWIYRIALNAALIARRTEQRRIHHHEQFAINAAVLQRSSATEEQQTDHEFIDRLYAAIRDLPELDASLVLMYLDGLSYAEMSTVIGISENYVGVKLNRIRREITDKLQGDRHES